jgi:acyl-CoA thioester hydrolase
MSALAELAEFRLTAPLPVRFRDLDAFGHVNNAVYATYLEEARVAYLAKVLGRVRPEDYGIIIARLEIDYRSPVKLGDELVVGARVTRLGGASFDMEYKIVEKKTGRLVLQAKTVQVEYDLREEKVRKLPEEFVAKVEEFDDVA